MHTSRETEPGRADHLEFPLSFAQQRLWFLEQLGGTGPSYTLAHALHIRGPLNSDALQRAVQLVVDRHASLRTTFEMNNDEPVQVVALRVRVDLPVVDLQHLPERKRRAELERLVNEEIRRPFDLAVGPLLRVLVLRIRPGEHVLTLCMHHIVTDGWSTGIFFRELSAAYNAYLRGHKPELGKLTIQYVDYAIWQREWLRGEILNSRLEYWQRRLEGAPVALELPTDRPRPAVQSYRGARITRQISQELLKLLKELGRQHGCTLFMTLLAAFQILLHRYTGQRDIVVGSPVAGRNRREHEGVIGFFANTLLFRVDLSGDPTCGDLLQRVRETALDAYAHQELPFEQLVKELKPDRNLSRAPLFQVLFALQNAPRQSLDFDGLEVTRTPVDTEAARFDLSLKITERDEKLTAVYEYNADLFDRSTTERMAGHFESLLNAIVANPRERISSLPLLSAAETHQLLVEWNDTGSDYPKDTCIHRLFEAQAARTPDAVALVIGNREVSYSELDRRSEQLSRYLQANGVGPEVVVAICMNRSLEMIVGLLGILKAGGAYLPLEPDDPPGRLAFMLDDADALLLLTLQPLLSGLEFFDAQVICLDSDWSTIEAVSEGACANAPTAESLAYIMYTSGSSGRPKGVLIPHRAVVRLVKGQSYVELNPDQVFLQLAPVSFDASTFEIWGCLLNGGRLILFDEEKPSLDGLVAAVRRHKVTIIWLTAGLFHLLANTRIDALTSVRQLLAGGDVLSVAQVQKALQALPHCRLINGYGPTENTTFTCCYPITGPCRSDTSIPIGRPIENTRVYILDPNRQPVPIGVPGELHAGGAGLARGYLNRPELTERRFIRHPFSDDPSARLYRTGDLARYLPDGNIEFLGRVDDQVKIRGFRVEPGEIEAALAGHPGVSECFVLAQDDGRVGKRLVAYIVPEEEQIPTLNELRSYMSRKLPAYMVPSAFVPVEALPLTRNGKIDRQALAALDEGRQTEQTYVHPRTLTERKLAEIWKKILWLDHDVGIHDNFFDLGGHSLLSVQLVAEIEEAFDQKLPVSALFQLSTVAELASVLGEGETFELPDTGRVKSPAIAPEIYHQLQALTAGWQGRKIGPTALMVGLNVEGSKQPLFWCLQGFRELSQLARYLGNDQPTYGMRSGHLVMKYTRENIEALASHYVEEILTVEPVGPYLVGGNCQAAAISFEMARQLQSRGKTVTLLCNLERFVPRLYQGRRALFFGRDSEFNPYKSFQTPELGWRKFSPAGFTLDLVSGVHGRFFDEPNVQILADKLERRIAQAQREGARQPPLEAGGRILSNEAYRAVISAPPGLTAAPGEELRIPVRVKNASAEIWQSTDSSGIALGNHWLNERGDVVQWLDGRATLDCDLPPGAAVELILPVTTPETPGGYLLEVDLVEEGIAWFNKKGSETTLITFQVVAAAGEKSTA